MDYPKLCYFFIIIIIIAGNSLTLFAQDDTRVTAEELKKIGFNYYNYSDPGKINIEITVLGGVRNPGRYLIPEGTNVIELLSLSGGIINEETSDNIKLIRSATQSGRLSDNKIITLDYKAIFKDEELKSVNKPNPLLLHGDILVVPITSERTFWDDFKDASSIIVPLTTLATLIISIISLNK
jgi:hypothetical protein